MFNSIVRISNFNYVFKFSISANKIIGTVLFAVENLKWATIEFQGDTGMKAFQHNILPVILIIGSGFPYTGIYKCQMKNRFEKIGSSFSTY